MKVIFCLFFSSFLCAFSYSQSPEIYTTLGNGKGCPATIILYSNATYFFQTGCEASPLISFGNWQVKKDIVKLTPVNPKTFQVIKSVSANKVKSDSIWVTLLDKDGVNMTHKISIGLEVPGRGSYMFSGDSTGTKKLTYKRSGGKLVLRTLNKLFNQYFEFSTDTTNNFTIALNLPANWINSTHAAWGGLNSFTFLKRKEGLSATAPNLSPPLTFIRQLKSSEGTKY